ncbi:DUF6089 family protein [Mesonia sp. K7]|uniref:type IX secretion system protein PorG n=1 Tax=Mesonia sp. K7 TaxID=2218606 RepID=UPI000DA82AFD|nr:DUF6089 family protein [Mesonia sp. K7]PZD78736.1 hypothetical protein DNG35_04605 [Mesonia sp. K7]
MRHFIAIFIMLLYVNISQGQTYEIGPYIGGSNYIGDIGSTQYVNPENLVVGGLFKWNRSNRHSFRLSVLHTTIDASDANSSDNRRIERDLAFENQITEVSLGLEYTFWEWNLHHFKKQLTPYLYTGLTGVFTDDKYLSNRTNTIITNDSKVVAAIPMVIGVKATLDTQWIFGVELGARYMFTDNFDGSTPEEFDGGEVYPHFGNQNTNDWYMFAGITVTYSFGRKPCYCNF